MVNSLFTKKLETGEQMLNTIFIMLQLSVTNYVRCLFIFADLNIQSFKEISESLESQVEKYHGYHVKRDSLARKLQSVYWEL